MEEAKCSIEQCDIFDFMAYHVGMTVLHPGGLWATEKTSSRFVLIFGLLFAFQPNSEVMQPATCFHDHIPKFGATEADNVVNDSIPLDIADNMFNTNANG